EFRPRAATICQMTERPQPPAATGLPVPVELIERRIYWIRGLKVMLDSDLAELYQVTTGNLNLAVRRNASRRLHVSARPGRVRELEIAICKLKFRLRRPALPAVRLH